MAGRPLTSAAGAPYNPPHMGDSHTSGKSRKWFWIRLAFYLLSFVVYMIFGGEIARAWTSQGAHTPWFTLAGMVFALVLIPFSLLLVISFQTINPLSDKVWSRPDHYSNPLRLRNPLPFFHFAGYAVIAVGCGVLVSSLWQGICAAIEGAWYFLAGLGILFGVWLSMKLCKSKTPPAEPPADQARPEGETSA